MRTTESWAVTVERNGEQVVTLASNCLSGRDISPEDERVIHMAAMSLLGFIGKPVSQADAGICPAPSEPELLAALRPFVPGAGDGVWGRIKAFIVNGAPTREEGIRLARQITEWQTAIPASAYTELEEK